MNKLNILIEDSDDKRFITTQSKIEIKDNSIILSDFLPKNQIIKEFEIDGYFQSLNNIFDNINDNNNSYRFISFFSKHSFLTKNKLKKQLSIFIEKFYNKCEKYFSIGSINDNYVLDYLNIVDKLSYFQLIPIQSINDPLDLIEASLDTFNIFNSQLSIIRIGLDPFFEWIFVPNLELTIPNSPIGLSTSMKFLFYLKNNFDFPNDFLPKYFINNSISNIIISHISTEIPLVQNIQIINLSLKLKLYSFFNNDLNKEIFKIFQINDINLDKIDNDLNLDKIDNDLNLDKNNKINNNLNLDKNNKINNNLNLDKNNKINNYLNLNKNNKINNKKEIINEKYKNLISPKPIKNSQKKIKNDEKINSDFNIPSIFDQDTLKFLKDESNLISPKINNNNSTVQFKHNNLINKIKNYLILYKKQHLYQGNPLQFISLSEERHNWINSIHNLINDSKNILNIEDIGLNELKEIDLKLTNEINNIQKDKNNTKEDFKNLKEILKNKTEFSNQLTQQIRYLRNIYLDLTKNNNNSNNIYQQTEQFLINEIQRLTKEIEKN